MKTTKDDAAKFLCLKSYTEVMNYDCPLVLLSLNGNVTSLHFFCLSIRMKTLLLQSGYENEMNKEAIAQIFEAEHIE